MKYGARNQIIGKVSSIDKGTLMCKVKLNIPAEMKMSSVMTIESMEEMGLKEGDKVKVIVKAINILLVKE